MEPSARPLMSCWENQVTRGSVGSSWIHGFDIMKLPALDLEDDGGFGRIALFIDGRPASYIIEVFGGGERITNFRAVGGIGAFDGIGEDHGGIIAERGHGIGGFRSAVRIVESFL